MMTGSVVGTGISLASRLEGALEGLDNSVVFDIAKKKTWCFGREDDNLETLSKLDVVSGSMSPGTLGMLV